MAYETKVLLTSLYELASRTESVDEMRELIRKMANIEGVILDPPVNAKPKKGEPKKGGG
jgi:ribosomal protein L31E